MTDYTPTYEPSDISSVVIDGIVEFGVNVLPFMALLALGVVAVVLLNMVRGR